MSHFLGCCVDDLLPQTFSDLISVGRLELLEIACSQDSVLTSTMQNLTGRKDAAERLSIWNGCDLSTNQGVRKAIQVISLKKPKHVWISPICGPYSMMQQVNQRSIQQCADLAEKRRNALKQYVGCSIIYTYARSEGCHVSWEWSETCQAWRLPLIQNLTKRFQPFFSVTKGCRVNLRNPHEQLMQKGWKVMSTQELMSLMLDLPCHCSPGTKHAPCEGHATKRTQYYTKEFAKRVCKAILKDQTKERIQQELSGRNCVPEGFGFGAVCECDLGKRHEACLTCGSCHFQELQIMVGDDMRVEAEDRSPEVANPRGLQLSKEEIQRRLRLLHAATGHRPKRFLIQTLQKRGVNAQVLEEARKFRCAVCEEKQRTPPRPLASLEPHPPKWSTVDADFGHWSHPHTKETVQFLMVIDEGSRFRVGRVLLSGTKKLHANAGQFLQGFQESWVQYFGFPNCLRLDPDGTFRSQAVQDYCDQNQIYLDMTPGEAHWKLGVCEQAIQGVKSVMDKIAEDDPECSSTEALSEAVRTFNNRELIRGFSPIQHALGRAPDPSGRLFPQGALDSPDLLVENPSGEMHRNLERMKSAETRFLKWSAQQRMSRAQNSRSRPLSDYHPGDLVYIWRKQVSGQKGTKNGKFIGPARILAVEQRQSADGSNKSSSSVWCVRGRRLVKCCPEQLRPASEREIVLEELEAGQYDDWDFHRVAKELGGNEFEDVSHDIPEELEWRRAQNPDMEWQPVRRCRGKRSAPQTIEVDVDPWQAEVDQNTHPSSSSRTRRRSRTPTRASAREHLASMAHVKKVEPDVGFQVADHWSEREHLQSYFLDQKDHGYWDSELAAVSIEVEMPQIGGKSELALRDLQGFLVNQFKRRAAIEVSEKRMTAEELQAFRGAKAIEVNNFLSAKAFEALPPELQPRKEQAVRMRWILTWKQKEDGSKKAKARAVLLGYQDPLYEHRATTSPTTTRQTRQLQMVISASRKFRTRKGDVTGAFLQSRPYPGELYCIPCPEICEAMGLPAESVTKVKKACYGLVDAPLEWYRSVCSFFSTLGLKRCWSDACCWTLVVRGQLQGIISGHVDDFIFSGNDESPEWKAVIEAIQKEYKWSDWEEGKFQQCGIQIEQHADFSFSLSQEKYVDDLKYINLRAHRRRDRKSETDDVEKTQLRALLGGVSWHAQQMAPHFSAEVGLLLSEVNHSTIDTVIRANQLLDHVKEQRKHQMHIRGVAVEDIQLVAWVDAGSQNRVDGGSTQGILIGAAHRRLLSGSCEQVDLISWHSQKIGRVCRSPGAAEAAAAVNGEDSLYLCRFQLSEMLGNPIDLWNVDEAVNQIPACLVTDSRNVYDKMETEVLSIKGAEKRTDISMLCLKEAQGTNEVEIRWVHSEAQLANGLTKGREYKQLSLFYDMNQRWRIVEDPERASARRRKAEGLGPLENADRQKHVLGREPENPTKWPVVCFSLAVVACWLVEQW